jgi:hypothetical protein
MDRIFLAIIASGVLVIVTVISLVAFYRDDRSASLRQPPGIGFMEPKQMLHAEPPALAADVFLRPTPHLTATVIPLAAATR